MTFYSTKPAIRYLWFYLNHSLSHHTEFNCLSPIDPIAPPWSISLPNIVLKLTELPKHSVNNTIIQAHFHKILADFPNALICYTDGSRFENRVGTAYLISDTLYRFRLRNSASVFTAELQAIFECLQIILSIRPNSPPSHYNSYRLTLLNVRHLQPLLLPPSHDTYPHGYIYTPRKQPQRHLRLGFES